MEVDPYELLVRWYLRFNGYLGVENFVVHGTVQGGNVQAGETDILAVRFPYSREDPGFQLQTAPELLDQLAADCGLVDFVVAEVKGGQNDTLNNVWRPPVEPEKLERVGYVIRWLGAFADETLIRKVATDLQASHRVHHDRFLFRVVMFAQKGQPKLSLRQVTFHDIANFLVNVRAPSWQGHGFGVRSPHNQWHPFIRELWKIADPNTGPDSGNKVDAILDRLKNAAERKKDSCRAKPRHNPGLDEIRAQTLRLGFLSRISVSHRCCESKT